MSKTSQKIKYITLLAIVIFTALSAFGGFVIMGRHMLDDPDRFITAGDTFVEDIRWSIFPIILILSTIQVCLLFSQNRVVCISRIILAVLSLLVTLLYKPLWDASDGLMGGLIAYTCEITWAGYIAIIISFGIVFSQICLSKKQG